MFEKLSHGFETAKNHFKGRTVLTQDNLAPALEIIRESLLDADVDYSVCENLLNGITSRCLGKTIQLRQKSQAKNITTTDFFVSMCFEELKRIFGQNPYPFEFKSTLGSVMLVGLQGVGKTTTAGKLAQLLHKQNPLLVACDIYRPAAVEQLKVVAQGVGVTAFFQPDTSPLDICLAAQKYAYQHDHKLMIIDTAGRLSIDPTLMREIAEIKTAITPEHTFLVVDAMMGQDAVKTAANFQESVDYDALIMTKLDGDARGGAALSISQLTGKPIAFVGTGETHHNLEKFHPEGFSTRVLGMGDSISLIEDLEKIEADLNMPHLNSLESLTFEKIATVLSASRKLGPLSHLLKKMPLGIAKMIQGQPGTEQSVERYIHLVNSMTQRERTLKDPIDDSRMRRIATGSGVKYQLAKTMISQIASTLSIAQNGGMKQLSKAMNLPPQFQNMLSSLPDGAMNDPSQLLSQMNQPQPQPSSTQAASTPATSLKKNNERIRKINKQKRKAARKNRKRK